MNQLGFNKKKSGTVVEMAGMNWRMVWIDSVFFNRVVPLRLS